MILLAPPHSLLHDRMGEAPLDPYHHGLILLVAHNNTLERALRHPGYSALARARPARFPVERTAGSDWPPRLCAATVLMRAISRRTARTRAVFSSWPVARWKRRLNCSFLSLSTSSSSWSMVMARASAAFICRYS